MGAAIAKKFAQKHGEKAKIALLGRSLTVPSHSKRSATLLETAKTVQLFGARALPVAVDMQDDVSLAQSVRRVCNSFRGLDVLVLNASTVSADPSPSANTVDWLFRTNIRATLRTIDECRPYLQRSQGSIVSISPPVRMGRLEWLSKHPAYTISKYGMTMATLSAASGDIRACTVWPRRIIATAATNDDPELYREFKGACSEGRSPSDFAEAVYSVSTNRRMNARCLFDEDVKSMAPCDAPLDVFADEPFEERYGTCF